MQLDVPNIGVLGAGAFGTALAIALSQADRAVKLWARDADQARQMQAARANARRLPGARFPDGLSVTGDIQDMRRVPTVLLAVPTQQLRAVLEAQADALTGAVLIACCKGVELGTGLLPAQVIQDVLPGAQVGVLTGPSFADDIAAGKPTALTLASAGPHRERLQRDLATHHLRVYLTDDLIGAQLGGALKNVVAIAAGITIGAGLGESARAALMTRGFSEMNRLAQARGAHAETLLGLSGLGDLVLTCTSDRSRNYRHGLAIGAGQVPDASVTVEGVKTAQALAADSGPETLPVTCMVAALCQGTVSLDRAMDLLLSRPLRAERG